MQGSEGLFPSPLSSTQTVGETPMLLAICRSFPGAVSALSSQLCFVPWPDPPRHYPGNIWPGLISHLLTLGWMLPPPHWSSLPSTLHLISDWLAGRTLAAPIGPKSRTVAPGPGPVVVIIRLDICAVLIRNIRVV